MTGLRGNVLLEGSFIAVVFAAWTDVIYVMCIISTRNKAGCEHIVLNKGPNAMHVEGKIAKESSKSLEDGQASNGEISETVVQTNL